MVPSRISEREIYGNMRMNTVALMSFVVFTLLLMTVKPTEAFPWEDEYYTYTLWGNRYSHTVNTVTGYVVNTTRSISSVSYFINDNEFGLNADWAVRLWLVSLSGSKTELTDGYNSINHSYVGSDWRLVDHTESDNFEMPETTVAINTAIEAGIYLRIEGGSWQRAFTLITEQFKTETIRNATWIVDYQVVYISLGFPFPPRTDVGTAFGNSSAVFRIRNFQIDKLNPWDSAEYELRQGDFVNFLIMPWSYFIGNVTWGFAVLFVEMTMFNKYQSVKPCVVFLWLFGGTGGVLTVMIPALGLHLSWFLLALALASTLWLLIR